MGKEKSTQTGNFVLVLVAMVLGVLIGLMFANSHSRSASGSLQGKLDEVLELVEQEYVEPVDADSVSERVVALLLSELDPHSTYLSARETERTDEMMRGNFEGVGLVLHREGDTTFVGQVLDDGPSAGIGILPGDMLVRVDGEKVSGVGMVADSVVARLRGPRGSSVTVEVERAKGKGEKFTIHRGVIDHKTLPCSTMLDDTTGYILLTSFASTTHNEFRSALRLLKRQGMRHLVLDLRGNGGGSLQSAVGVAGELLPTGSLIVYTQGAHSRRHDVRARSGGLFTDGRVTVMIDESSASASEVVSGALQDNDRATVVGRRSFGKGLVQTEFELRDGSSVLLTTARYYTPSGRCIQRSYDEGSDAYRQDVNNRYKNGELVSADSIHFADSLKYKTAHGRTVYGGGGIMPDIFVPMDTMRLSDYFISLRGKGLLNSFPLQWADAHRKSPEVKTFELFLQHYDSFGLDSLLAAEGIEKGVVRDLEKETAEPERTVHSDNYMHLLLKAQVAKDLFGTEYYYKVMKEVDDGYQQALKLLK